MNWQYRNTLLALCTLAFFSTMVARVSISPLVPAITKYFEVSNTAIGFALTGMWLAYGLTQFPSGILGDRFGERVIILASVGGTAAMGLILAITPTFTTFFVSVVMVGAVAGLHYSVATTLLTKHFRENIGKAVGIHGIGAPSAGLLAPICAAWLGTRYGWRVGVVLIAVAATPVFILFAWKVRKSEPKYPNLKMLERINLGSIHGLLSQPAIVFTVLVAAVFAFVWQGLASFLPTFLIEYQGQSLTHAGLIFSAYFVVQAVAKPIVGSLSDIHGRDSVIILCLITTILGIGLFVAVPGMISNAIAVVLIGIGLAWSSAVEPRFLDELSIDEQNTGLGLIRTTYLLLGSIGSIIVGLIADKFGWATSFSGLILILSIVTICVLINEILGLGY